MATLAPSFLIRSSSFLQLTWTTINSRQSTNFGQIRQTTVELAALERLEKSRENLSSGFPTRSDINRAVHPQEIANGLKFQIKAAERLYYRCGENKDADQLPRS